MPDGVGTAPNILSIFGANPSVTPLSGGTVPSTPKAAPTTTVSQDLSAMWDKMQASAPQTDPALFQRAITPMVTGHALGMPSSMTTPIAPYQQRPMNTQPVVGKHNARMRGIGNAVTGITNAIGSIAVAKQQRDQRSIAASTQRLLQSQQAIDQATAVLNSGQFKPDSPEYKNLQTSIQKNTQVRDDILSDEKVRKGVEKGFNMSFTDPSKNKTLEHAGVQDGIKSFGEQFASKMPEEVGPNVMAQQQLQMQMQQQQLNQASQKNFLTYALASKKLDQTMTIAQMRENQENARKQAELDQRWNMQSRAMDFAGRLQSNKYANEFELVKARSNAALAANEDLFNFKTSSEAFSKWQTSDIALGKAIEGANDTIRKIENDMALNEKQIKADPNLLKDYQAQLDSMKKQRELFTEQQSANRQIMKSLAPSMIPDMTEEGGEGSTEQNPMNNIFNFVSEDSMKSYDEATGHAITAF